MGHILVDPDVRHTFDLSEGVKQTNLHNSAPARASDREDFFDFEHAP